MREPWEDDRRALALVDSPSLADAQSPHSLQASQGTDIPAGTGATGGFLESAHGRPEPSLGFPVELIELPHRALRETNFEIAPGSELEPTSDGTPGDPLLLPEPPKMLPDEGVEGNLLPPLVAPIVVRRPSGLVT